MSLFGFGNGWAPCMRQAITWSNNDPIHLFGLIFGLIILYHVISVVFELVDGLCWNDIRDSCLVFRLWLFEGLFRSRVRLYLFTLGITIDCPYCPASRTTLVATRFRVAVICPIIQVPHCIRVFFYFVWFVFINHIFQFYYELCTYCNILDIYLS